MTGTRDQLAAALAAALTPAPESKAKPWLIIPSPDEVDVAAGYQAGLLVFRTEMTPLPNRGGMEHAFEAIVMVPQTSGNGLAENALDLAADRLIEAMDPLDWLTWSKAERFNYLDRYPAWRFTLSVPTIITEE